MRGIVDIIDIANINNCNDMVILTTTAVVTFVIGTFCSYATKRKGGLWERTYK